MKKILALLSLAAVPAFADVLTVTDATLGDIENTAKVVTGVSIDLSAYALKSEAFDDTALKARLTALEGKTNDWDTAATKAGTAVQTVVKATDGATELSVNQSGTGVTIDIDLSDYAKTADAYSHPTFTAHESGLYKITVNGEGHVTAATAVAKADITALGIPAQDTVYDETALAARVSTVEGLLSDIADIETDDLSTLNECIAAIKAIVAAAQ